MDDLLKQQFLEHSNYRVDLLDQFDELVQPNSLLRLRDSRKSEPSFMPTDTTEICSAFAAALTADESSL